jgi:predicted HicB family RNase H-like nuclease
MMEYKGYFGKVEFDDEAEVFHGEIVNTRDVITFQGKSVAELRKAFRESIEDYLAFCGERGETPEKPFSGRFVTRLSPELHRQVSMAAAISGKSLNAWLTEQLENAVQRVASAKSTEEKTAAKTAKKLAKRRKDLKQRA